MKLFIPHLGDKFILAETATLHVLNEYRNAKFLEKVLGEYDGAVFGSALSTKELTLPEGTILTVDRIFIRKGAPEYDSITFLASLPNKVKGRFWIPLSQLDSLVFMEFIPKRRVHWRVHYLLHSRRHPEEAPVKRSFTRPSREAAEREAEYLSKRGTHGLDNCTDIYVEEEEF